MDSIMESTNLYKRVKVDNSEKSVKRGFTKTVIHILILLLAIIIMSVYEARLEFTKTEQEVVDTTKNEYIPYAKYEEIDKKYFNTATILTCDCKRNQISWSTITEELSITDDDICITSYIAADPCYRDPVCQNSKVYSVLYWQLSELCETARYLYPSASESPRGSVTTSTLITNDDLFGRAREEALGWMNEITTAFRTSYEMNYRFINDDKAFFYDWANSVTLEELSNESYWLNDWNMTYNASFWMALSWSEWLYSDTDYYYTIGDAINEAFLSDIEIIYRYYQNGTDAQEGYYEKCQPYQCVWLLPGKKTPLEIATTVFALIGGIHASLFLIINIGHNLYKKCKGQKDEDDDGEGDGEDKEKQDKKDKLEVQMSKHQEAAALTTAGNVVHSASFEN